MTNVTADRPAAFSDFRYAETSHSYHFAAVPDRVTVEGSADPAVAGLAFRVRVASSQPTSDAGNTAAFTDWFSVSWPYSRSLAELMTPIADRSNRMYVSRVKPLSVHFFSSGVAAVPKL